MTTGSIVPQEKLMFAQLFKNLPMFMESEGPI